MSEFECLVSDLIEKTPNKEKHKNVEYNENSSDETNLVNISDVKTPALNSVSNSNSNSLYDKIKSEKNIRMFFIILLIYLFLNSSQIIDFVKDKFPQLISDENFNLSGSIIIGSILSMSVVVITSF